MKSNIAHIEPPMPVAMRFVAICALLLACVAIIAPLPAFAQATTPSAAPTVTVTLPDIGDALQPQQFSDTMILFIALTVLSLAPAILVMTTSFIRIIVVLGFVRQAMGTQQTPPNQVLVGLALILTFFIMAPTYQRVYDEAYQPYSAGEITSQSDALANAWAPVRDFMFKQVDTSDYALFSNIARKPRPASIDDISPEILIPAYVLSELRTAFIMGFVIFIPFLIIDMVVASTLMAMGMMMLPPIFVSLPFKIILFVLADGWKLIIESLVKSFA